MPDDVIRSHLPNDNYRRGWEETFGKTDGEPRTIPSGCQCGWFLCDRCKARMAPARADVDPVAMVNVGSEPEVLPRRCMCGHLTCDRCRWFGGFPSEVLESVNPWRPLSL